MDFGKGSCVYSTSVIVPIWHKAIGMQQKFGNKGQRFLGVYAYVPGVGGAGGYQLAPQTQLCAQKTMPDLTSKEGGRGPASFRARGSFACSVIHPPIKNHLFPAFVYSAVTTDYSSSRLACFFLRCCCNRQMVRVYSKKKKKQRRRWAFVEPFSKFRVWHLRSLDNDSW